MIKDTEGNEIKVRGRYTITGTTAPDGLIVAMEATFRKAVFSMENGLCLFVHVSGLDSSQERHDYYSSAHTTENEVKITEVGPMYPVTEEDVWTFLDYTYQSGSEWCFDLEGDARANYDPRDDLYPEILQAYDSVKALILPQNAHILAALQRKQEAETRKACEAELDHELEEVRAGRI